MYFKRNIRILLQCIGINLLLLIAAAGVDIFLSSLLFRFSSRAFTIACFAVAGIFTGLFCYSVALEEPAIARKTKTAAVLTIIIIALCALLFFGIASLSGGEYNWPFKMFAVLEVVIVLFLRRKHFSYTQ